MKLNAAQQRTVEDQLGVEALPDENPAMPKLREVFGDHTFFVDAEGLNVVEQHPEEENVSGVVIKLASWAEDNTQLRVHEPEVLPVKVELAKENGSDSAA
ncbi:MAG TPA: hypothetical protein VMM59_04345 [Thermohalobaculum sp.]|nr:hypothetical protein [Thermohalobaculum sp.]